MKTALLLSLALAIAPLPALAQDGPPPGAPAFGPGAMAPGTPNPQMFAAMAQTRAQLQQLRLQARSRMLASLTPAHRTLLANIVGNLALSANPDPRVAAAQLDAQFAPAEKQSIVAIDEAVHANARALMERQRAAFETSLSADERARLAEHKARMEAFLQSHPRPAPDAGMIALRTLGDFGRHEMGFGPRG